MQVKDRSFIVTGSGSGLGAATARRLVAAGGRVLLVDLNAEAVSALAGELGANARFVQADVSDAASAQAAVAECRSAFGPVHGLVNCAGVAPAEKVLGRDGPHKLESFARTVQINLVGTFNMLRLAAEAIAQSAPGPDGERGVIINTASVAAFDGQIGQAGYAASKGGVVAMTLPIARELARHGIRVVTIAPGIMETPMLKGMPTEVQDALGKTVPFPSRMGQPDEFARLVLHILDNAYLNGEVIRLDGAIRMASK
ncbi:3-hydroxyacyl-CoA dehydrogenase [Azohydromonas lata]|uniref:3-hydroxyacyl-CoA dehydrogenase n=1 Tax=Azohydromonas lata TaxID=45677 RepID=UPI00082C2DA4|nr:3-hydroxyacyl-CoA dehydrogenase [Azohydromonas lata]